MGLLWINTIIPGDPMWYHSCNLREGNGTPLQCSCLENPMDRGAWKAAVHGVAEGRTRLSDFTFTFHFHASEKEMATHSSVVAWRIPGTGKPGGLPSMESHRVGHDWRDLAAAAAVAISRPRHEPTGEGQPSCSGWSPFPWNEKTAVHIRKATQIYTVI